MDTSIRPLDIEALTVRVNRQRAIDAELRTLNDLPVADDDYSLVVELLAICDLYAQDQAKRLRRKRRELNPDAPYGSFGDPSYLPPMAVEAVGTD